MLVMLAGLGDAPQRSITDRDLNGTWVRRLSPAEYDDHWGFGLCGQQCEIRLDGNVLQISRENGRSVLRYRLDGPPDVVAVSEGQTVVTTARRTEAGITVTAEVQSNGVVLGAVHTLLRLDPSGDLVLERLKGSSGFGPQPPPLAYRRVR